ncbi:GGDEF domain-containing protein [Novosphingobium olei]|uniref:Diguanylate cyclase n=1 Tax=Novosphingobium olei TaxID=2728851 RepID=A0A7Y0BNA1_9SPHN|nr:sensor domain-containing diguanylate cyclase [Novosphingobium olei]NML93423.1 diguanylate cyclase [Novosphingobium olei]
MVAQKLTIAGAITSVAAAGASPSAQGQDFAPRTMVVRPSSKFELANPIVAAGTTALILLFACALPLARLSLRRRELERQLLEAEARYRLLANSTSEVVLRADMDGTVTYASPAAASIGLWREGGPIGANLLDLVAPERRGDLGATLEGAVSGQGDAVWQEFHLVGAEGSEGWFEVRIQPLEDADGTTRSVVANLRSIAERKQLEDQLYEAGLTDAQTGLSNRRAFIAMLEHHLGEQSGGCIALFDLDHFRALNDRHGHLVGDKVLLLFANLLRSLVRGGDTVARIGGEKFGVLLPGASTEQAETVVARVLSSLSGTTRAVDNVIVRVSASAGVARLGGTADEALRSADLALQVAKAKGRDRLELAPRLRIERHSRW